MQLSPVDCLAIGFSRQFPSSFAVTRRLFSQLRRWWLVIYTFFGFLSLLMLRLGSIYTVRVHGLPF